MKWLLALALLLLALPAHADEARPLYIEARLADAATLDLAWRVPPSLRPGAIPDLRLPPGCATTGAIREWSDGLGHHRAGRWACTSALAGQRFTIDWPLGNPNLSTIYRTVLPSGQAAIGMHLPGTTALPFPTNGAQPESGFADYLVLGVEHIWLGFDHLLFVACLVWIAGNFRRVAITVTGFTLGHSLTLAAAALDWVSVPIRAVEVLIALSIVLLAVELARGPSDSLTWRHPLAVSSGFGLLHGFGFAAVLREVGLPSDGLLGALLAFNLGIEAGQLLFVIALIAIAAVLKAAAPRLLALLPRQPDAATRAAAPRLLVAYLVGTTAMFWMLQRLA